MNAGINTAGRIVVGTDGSARANKAVNWAAEQAMARDVQLLVLFVVPAPQPVRTLAATTVAFEQDLRTRSQQHLDTLLDRLHADYPKVAIEGKVLEGYASYILAQASKDAELVVVGARGQGAPLSVRLLGGVSDAVAAHAHGPVAVITDEAQINPGGPVVVGVDDSDQARVAVKLAFEAAETRGVPLVAVHAWDYGPADPTWDPSVWEQTTEAFKQALTEMMNQMLAEGKAAHPQVPVELRIVGTRPSQALIDASNEAGLVVVGSRGRGGFAGLLLGSTSKRVLREAHCPVIVTRG